MPESPPKVVSFDGDNTLWNFEEAQRAALAAVSKEFSRLHIGAVPLDVDRLIAIRAEVGMELGEGRVSLLELRREGLRQVVAEAGVDPTAELIGRLFEVFVFERDRSNRLYDDVKATLQHLKSNGWSLVLLSNGNASVSAVGLSDTFAAMLYAEEIGARKPNLAAFEAVSAATDCPLDRLVHVGDSLEHDVAGAIRAGATAVWLNRDRVPNETGIEPHHEIESLHELPPILERIS